MNYYLDTEFIEDFTSRTLNIPSFRWKEKKHYVDLISIGIVSEDGREYYAVNKEFDLKHVWNKYDTKYDKWGAPYKEYWLRENILRPLHKDLCKNISGDMKNQDYFSNFTEFSYQSLRSLISIYGKTRVQIAQEIKAFTAGIWDVTMRMPKFTLPVNTPQEIEQHIQKLNKGNPPTFYGYYCDYDWVVFCSLFGRMLDLPNGYPMYMRDLKQMLDETGTEEWKLKPKNPNEHHALSDARWNRSLHLNIKEWYHLQQFPTSADKPNLVTSKKQQHD